MLDSQCVSKKRPVTTNIKEFYFGNTAKATDSPFTIKHFYGEDTKKVV